MIRESALGTLAAAVAHEVNNPLAVVLVNLHTIRRMLAGLSLDDDDTATIDTVLEVISDCEESARRVSGVVDQLRMFSAPTAAVPDRVDLREVVDICYRLLRPELAARAEVELALGEAPKVSAHASDLGRLLLHLIARASASLVADARRTNRIRISTDTLDGQGRIEVRVTPTHADRAVGAGLEEARAVVSDLGGRLEARREGDACVLTALLPAARAVKLSPDDAPPTRGRVLVLDDERLVLRAVRRLLQSEHEVVVLSDGNDALERDDLDDFDVLLVDVRMPHMTGPEFHQALAARHPHSAERLIFMSGGADYDLVGPDGLPAPCLEKPVSADRLRAVVRDMVSRGR